MDFAAHCDQITEQTDLLARLSLEGDLTATVPTVGGWTVAMLLRHIGGGHRWAEGVVTSRATQPVPDTQPIRDLEAHAGATALTAALREAGPDAELWTPVPSGRTAFYARRFAHEALLHRADGELALG